MVVDEIGEIALTKYRNGNIVETYHNMLTLEINLTFHKAKDHERTEVFNLRNTNCQQIF